MIRGIFKLSVIENNKIIKEIAISNKVLDSGLLALLGVGDYSISDTIFIGSSDLDVDLSQEGLIDPIFQISKDQVHSDGWPKMQVSLASNDNREIAWKTLSYRTKRKEAIGKWAEISMGGINRALIRELGNLPSGNYEYLVTSVNVTGESEPSNIIEISSVKSNSSSRISWNPPGTTASIATIPTSYKIYRKIGQSFYMVGEVPKDRNYFYDRNENVTDHKLPETFSAFLGKPLNVAGGVHYEPTPKPFIKNDMQEIDIRVEFYIGNSETINPVPPTPQIIYNEDPVYNNENNSWDFTVNLYGSGLTKYPLDEGMLLNIVNSETEEAILSIEISRDDIIKEFFAFNLSIPSNIISNGLAIKANMLSPAGDSWSGYGNTLLLISP